MQKIIPNKERLGYLALFAMIAGGFLYAESVVGKFQVFDTSGQLQFEVDSSDGAVKARKIKKARAGTNLILEASDGTDIGGFNEYGVPLVLDSGNAWGTQAAPAAANDTHTISITFDNVTGDTVTPNAAPGYEIMLSTRGVTSSAGNVAGPYVGDRYANGFQIINPALLGSGVTFVWRMIRTSDISP